MAKVTMGYMLAIETDKDWKASPEGLSKVIQDYVGGGSRVDVEVLGEIDCYEGEDD